LSILSTKIETKITTKREPTKIEIKIATKILAVHTSQRERP